MAYRNSYDDRREFYNRRQYDDRNPDQRQANSSRHTYDGDDREDRLSQRRYWQDEANERSFGSAENRRDFDGSWFRGNEYEDKLWGSNPQTSGRRAYDYSHEDIERQGYREYQAPNYQRQAGSGYRRQMTSRPPGSDYYDQNPNYYRDANRGRSQDGRPSYNQHSSYDEHSSYNNRDDGPYPNYTGQDEIGNRRHNSARRGNAGMHNDDVNSWSSMDPSIYRDGADRYYGGGENYTGDYGSRGERYDRTDNFGSDRTSSRDGRSRAYDDNHAQRYGNNGRTSANR